MGHECGLNLGDDRGGGEVGVCVCDCAGICVKRGGTEVAEAWAFLGGAEYQAWCSPPTCPHCFSCPPLSPERREVARLKEDAWRSREDHVGQLWRAAVERNDRSWM